MSTVFEDLAADCEMTASTNPSSTAMADLRAGCSHHAEIFVRFKDSLVLRFEVNVPSVKRIRSPQDEQTLLEITHSKIIKFSENKTKQNKNKKLTILDTMNTI